MTSRTSFPDPRLPRSLATAPWASTRCQTPQCPHPAMVDDLCSSCALLALEYNEREAATVVGWELDARAAAEAHAGQFRFAAMPGRVDAGVQDLESPEASEADVTRWWRRFSAVLRAEERLADSQGQQDGGNSAAAQQRVPLECWVPCPGKCGGSTLDGTFCAACLPKKQQVWAARQARFAAAEAMLAARPDVASRPDASPAPVSPSPLRADNGVVAYEPQPLGLKFWLTLLGIAFVAKGGADMVTAWRIGEAAVLVALAARALARPGTASRVGRGIGRGLRWVWRALRWYGWAVRHPISREEAAEMANLQP